MCPLHLTGLIAFAGTRHAKYVPLQFFHMERMVEHGFPAAATWNRMVGEHHHLITLLQNSTGDKDEPHHPSYRLNIEMVWPNEYNAGVFDTLVSRPDAAHSPQRKGTMTSLQQRVYNQILTSPLRSWTGVLFCSLVCF